MIAKRKEIFENKLGLSNIVIERAHRVGEKSEERTRRIVMKMLNLKTDVLMKTKICVRYRNLC